MAPPKDFAEDIVAIIQQPSVRADVVPLYATALLMECFARPPQAKTSWREVNDAIIGRWSLSALIYIKERAWKSAQAQARERSTSGDVQGATAPVSST